MKSFCRAAVLAIGMLGAGGASAEILHNIHPYDSLAAIQKKYPNATITKVDAAWVTEDKAFYQLTGSGFPGVLYLAFERPIPARKAMWDAIAEREARNQASPNDLADKQILDFLLQLPEADQLSINWVRWQPPQPIPFERYRAKYGKPEKCDYSTLDMRPICSWPSRALIVSLSDNKANVLMVDAAFTQAEVKRAGEPQPASKAKGNSASVDVDAFFGGDGEAKPASNKPLRKAGPTM